jgi:hypothetical protein
MIVKAVGRLTSVLVIDQLRRYCLKSSEMTYKSTACSSGRASDESTGYSSGRRSDERTDYE